MPQIAGVFNEKSYIDVLKYLDGYDTKFFYDGNAEEHIDEISDAKALIIQNVPISRDTISKMPNLKVIVRAGIGVDSVDCVAAREFGVDVCNVPDYCVDEVAQHTMAILFSLLRNLPGFRAQLERGDWSLSPVIPIRRFSELTIGFLGYGRIAENLAKYISSVFKKIIVCRKSNKSMSNGVEKVDFDTLLTESDAIIVLAGLNDSTKGIFNKDAFAKMKDTAVIINTSRGGLIDEDALLDALQSGKIAGAGLDVFRTEYLDDNNPLYKMNNVVCTPHLAYYSKDSLEELKEGIAFRAKLVLEGKPPIDVVN